MQKNTNMTQFPVAERPCQYVALFMFQVPTLEGPGYVFMAADAFSEFGFHLGVEKDESPESVLKAIYLLTENPDFLKHRDKGFTLVLDKYEELSDRINAIINHVKGKVMFDRKYNHHISSPVLRGFGDLLKKRS